MEWQSIETAPKDGAEIIIYDAGWSESGIAHCWWDGNWQVVGREDITRTIPTHWMPIPKAPTK